MSLEAGSPGSTWGGRTPTHALLGGVLRWASRLAGAAFVVALADRSLRVAGAAGVAVLLAAPLVAMLVAAVQYSRERDWREAGLALLLLLMLLVGAWLGGA
jgi:MFS superfamily sulfate permease-like transporter